MTDEQFKILEEYVEIKIDEALIKKKSINFDHVFERLLDLKSKIKEKL